MECNNVGGHYHRCNLRTITCAAVALCSSKTTIIMVRFKVSHHYTQRSLWADDCKLVEPLDPCWIHPCCTGTGTAWKTPLFKLIGWKDDMGRCKTQRANKLWRYWMGCSCALSYRCAFSWSYRLIANLPCFSVKYFSPTTNVCIIRVARDQHNIAWGALTLLTSIEGGKYIPNVIHVSGECKVSSCPALSLIVSRNNKTRSTSCYSA